MPAGDPTIAYAAAKAALDTISRNLAAAWSQKHGITVNSISVGATDTDALRDAMAMFGGGNAEGMEEQMASYSLLKRIGTVEDVASIVAFVASPGAGWITGELLISTFPLRRCVLGRCDSADRAVCFREPDTRQRWSALACTKLIWATRGVADSKIAWLKWKMDAIDENAI